MEIDFGFITTAIIASLGVLYILFIAASVTREEMGIHDLRVKSHTLRNNYARTLARLRGEIDEELMEVDILDDDGNVDTEIEHQVAQEVANASKAA